MTRDNNFFGRMQALGEGIQADQKRLAELQAENRELRGEIEQLETGLRSVNAVAIERGDKYGACDQIDNDGQPYQSEWFQKLLQPQGERT